MKKNILFYALAAALTLSSCASKKALTECQNENKSLTTSLQNTREDLAAKNARLQSLEEQLLRQPRSLRCRARSTRA